MKIRCELHVNGGARRLLLVPGPQETAEHLALKLAGAVLFWPYEPRVEIPQDHPALAGQDFKPDLVGLDVAGDIALWVECGNVSVNKVDKLTRRLPGARLIVLKASEEEARRQRAVFVDEVARHGNVEVWGWPKAAFADWLGALREVTHVVGETEGRSLNLVINETPIAADLTAF